MLCRNGSEEKKSCRLENVSFGGHPRWSHELLGGAGLSFLCVCFCSGHEETGCYYFGKAKSTLSLGRELPSTSDLVQGIDSCLGGLGHRDPPGPRNGDRSTAVCAGMQLRLQRGSIEAGFTLPQHYDRCEKSVRRCPYICICPDTFCSSIYVLPGFKHVLPWSGSPGSFK